MVYLETMSDEQPPPDGQPPAGSEDPAAGAPGPGGPGGPGTPGAGPGPAGQSQPAGIVPAQLEGHFYNVGLVILLTVVTCGIWGGVWTYRTSEDLKKYNGDGLGGVLAVVIYILVSVVLMFTIPNEIEKMYRREGRESPVNAIWGLWFLLPVIGNIVWYIQVQKALNDFWTSKGARPA